MKDDRIREIISKMMYDDIYWGYVFSKVKRVNTSDFGSPFAVTFNKDGTLILLYDWNMISETSDANIRSFLEHEGTHLINRHLTRLMGILSMYKYEEDDPRIESICYLYGIACDCVVNIQAKIPRILKVNSGDYHLIFPDLYSLPIDRSAEWYYYKLLSEAKKRSSGGKYQGEDHKGDKKQCPNEGCIISHSKWSQGSTKGDLSGLIRKIDYNIAKISRESFNNIKDRGRLPGYISELVRGMLEPPKAPYYKIIRQLVVGSKLTKFKMSFSRVNRKLMYVFSYADENEIPLLLPFPGRTRDYSFTITILIDTSMSQSINEDIKEALNGIKDIIENDPYTILNVLEVDTKVQKEYQVKNIKDIQFNIKGRGGTTLTPGLERAKKLNSDVTLCFTDGHCDNINNVDRKRIPRNIIWVIPEKDGKFDHLDKVGLIVKIK
jgi:hypothetical protein